jgi:sugar/nucleoside kinase (ribokinase family)
MNTLFQDSNIRPTVIGTGLITLDIILNQTTDAGPQIYAGGTCGNVMAILGYLGWNVVPLARLNNDAAAVKVKGDLKRWGINLDYTSLSPNANTPIIVQEIKRNSKGHSYHKFSWTCPQCGAWLPAYKAVLANAIKDIAPKLPHPDVFFFDRVSRGALILAEKCRNSGAIIFFEPSGPADIKQFREAVQLSHIVKYAEDRSHHFKELIEVSTPLLEIETLGKRGLRYRSSLRFTREREWIMRPPFETDLVDTAGAGDWCSAGIINSLGQLGIEELKNISSESFMNALQMGQAMASWACTFEGPRGGMYQAEKGEFSTFIESTLKYCKLLKEKSPKNSRHSKTKHEFECPACSSATTELRRNAVQF